MTDRLGQQLGNYQLVRLLGRGGQAEVYLGEHRYLKSEAALKVLHASLDGTHAEQFLAEAQTLARLVHPAIVRGLDFTVEQGTPVLIMDYSPAGTMRQRYSPGTCVSLAIVVSAVNQVASALHYAHNHHVIHRDVKPENLLLGPRDEVLLSDFGLSVFAPSPELLSTQAMAGTLPYMAPEQLQGHPCFASDQYSLAIVTYEWLTGKRPFTGTLWQLIQQHLEAAPPPLGELNPSVPLAVEAVVLHALAKDPRDRYVSVQGFAQALLHASQQAQSARLEDSQQTWPLPSLLPPLADSTSELLTPPSQQNQATSPTSSQTAALTRRTPALSSQDQARTQQASSARPSLAPEQQDRVRLLKALGKAYREALESSLQGVASIRLTMGERLDLTQVEHPASWQLAQKERLLPEGTTILQVYDEATTGLLILGNPGAGKSTLLYELAQVLITRAQQEEQHPIPVVLNLSLWAAKRLPLSDWIVEHLELRYAIPRKLGKRWQQEERWLLLLDGLDEVALAVRPACVEAINAYLGSRTRLISPVVCSRLQDYEALREPLRLPSVVVVQPLTAEQVETYLTKAGPSLAAVREVVQRNPGLQELLTTPLMLNVVTLAYRDQAVADLPQLGLAEEQQRHIFASYLERMLPASGKRSSPSSQKMQRSLLWLAQQMRARSQSILYLEQLQPDWLSSGWAQLFYRWVGVVLPGSLIGLLVSFIVNMLFLYSFDPILLLEASLLGGVVGGILSSEPIPLAQTNPAHTPRHVLALVRKTVIVGLGVGLGTILLEDTLGLAASFNTPLDGICFGLATALLTVLLSLPLPERSSRREATLPPERTWAREWSWKQVMSSDLLRYRLMIGGLVGLGAGLSYGLAGPDADLISGLSFGLINGLIWGLCGAVMSWLLVHRPRTIVPTEMVLWSWKSLRQSLMNRKHTRNAFLIALGIGVSTGLINGLPAVLANGLHKGLSYGLIAGLPTGLSLAGSYWLLVGLSQGISGASFPQERRGRPNRGIQRSGRNGLLLGVLSGSIAGVICGLDLIITEVLHGILSVVLPSEQITELNPGLRAGLSYGLSIGLTGGLGIGLAVTLLVLLLMGGLAWWRHWVLRFLLWRSGALPWRLVPLLDEATQRILLRKVGGGYRFIHDLFRDYLATLDPSELSGLVAQETPHHEEAVPSSE